MPDVKQKLIILGSYAFAEEIFDLAEDIGTFEIVAFAENWDRSRCETTLLGRPIIWVDDLATYGQDCLAICSIGSTRRAAFIQQVSAFGIGFATLRHPSAHVLSSAVIGDGCVLSINTIVASHATLGSHVILNRAATVGHHTTIEIMLRFLPVPTSPDELLWVMQPTSAWGPTCSKT
ncbi:MAG: hypothetical protein H7175_21360 [Burkholderiales bacterium]|nr:hypothetical protein [Anaerolineae bacterium]